MMEEYERYQAKMEKYKKYGVTVQQGKFMEIYLEKICRACTDERKGTGYNLDECPIFLSFHAASVFGECEPVAIEQEEEEYCFPIVIYDGDEPIVIEEDDIIDTTQREYNSYINEEQQKLLDELRQKLCEYCICGDICNNKHDCKLMGYFLGNSQFKK